MYTISLRAILMDQCVYWDYILIERDMDGWNKKRQREQCLLYCTVVK
uniref:GM09708p n=1 Tax=Drosophila melanogaster TaxID=7227 RepID=Q95S41_DROME|nr:GM09708p [Drosophila melanogaster]